MVFQSFSQFFCFDTLIPDGVGLWVKYLENNSSGDLHILGFVLHPGADTYCRNKPQQRGAVPEKQQQHLRAFRQSCHGKH
jgi:hypothetical protein